MKGLQELIAERVAQAIASNPGAPLDDLRLPEDGSHDFIPFDPTAVRIKRGRIKLPGIGWVKADVAPLPRTVRLTSVTARLDGDGWEVKIETEANVAA